jgi:hypothetical protein
VKERAAASTAAAGNSHRRLLLLSLHAQVTAAVDGIAVSTAHRRSYRHSDAPHSNSLEDDVKVHVLCEAQQLAYLALEILLALWPTAHTQLVHLATNRHSHHLKGETKEAVAASK